MRSTLFLAALAAGAAHAYEKRVYVTDWTTVTVTKTVTAPAVTETVAAVQQNQADTVTLTSTSTPVQAPAPVAETTSSLTSDLAKKSTEVVPEQPATTQAAQQEPVSSWSTAWTSTFEAAAATTLQPQPQPTSSSSSSTSSAAASTGGATVTKDYQEKVLYNHNVHRSNHSSPSLEWHDDLLQAAFKLAEKCVYEHDVSIDNTTVKYGQNIGYGTTTSQVGVMISNMMYNDEIDYYPTPYGAASPNMDLFDKWGHFSQIVWKGTTHVACYTQTCEDLGNVDGKNIPFTVCNYSPPGNYDGQYGDNVLAPGNAATYSA